MTFRCPYCKQILGEKPSPRCPRCGKNMIVPDRFQDRPFLERRRDRLKIEREGERKRRAMLARRVPFGRPASPLLLVAVLAVLGAMLVGRTRHAFPRRPRADPLALAAEEVGVLRTAAENFREDCGRYPTAAEGLKALIHRPAAAGWDGPYVTLIRPDPWRRPYQYQVEGSGVTVFSLGPDGREGTGGRRGGGGVNQRR